MTNPFRSTTDEAMHRAEDFKDKAEGMIKDFPTREAQDEAQGRMVKALSRAERAPDTLYLGLVFASMAMSLLLLTRKKRGPALFVGLWPVTILNLAMMLKNRHPSSEVAAMRPDNRHDDPLLAE